MRHRKSGRKLGRNPSHRKALLRNMAKALLDKGRITTTEAKAKSLRGVVEPLITLALKNDLHARRQAYDVLGCHKLVKRLFDDIGPLFVGGGGGYTRVVKLALPRKGDSAPLALIELSRKPGEAAPLKAPKTAGREAPAAAAPVEKNQAPDSPAAEAAPETPEAETPEVEVPAAKVAEAPADEQATEDGGEDKKKV
ncbi:50S ribosomal protein L17 [Desulfovibrio sp. OttesenSCG-928-G11]|nr:50S ribosomal protein L17 [Desulfovibrio sp. OttesenSCG-928-G11]